MRDLIPLAVISVTIGSVIYLAAVLLVAILIGYNPLSNPYRALAMLIALFGISVGIGYLARGGE